ncbi:MAG: hypothetical protein ABEJ98_04835, partial [Candidatus Nanohaloarchaea archaeon]
GYLRFLFAVLPRMFHLATSAFLPFSPFYFWEVGKPDLATSALSVETVNLDTAFSFLTGWFSVAFCLFL